MSEVGPAMPPDVSSSKKKRKREKEAEYGFKTSSGVNYNVIHDRPVEDARFERQMKAKQAQKEGKSQGGTNVLLNAPSSTVDALNRMVLGLEQRTIADKIQDPNRPTWEQYKKDNKDKLEIGSLDQKQMLKYRAELDAAREKALKKNSQQKSGRDDASDDSRAKKSKKKKRHSSRRDKDKKKKSKKRSRSSDSSSGSESDDSSDSTSRKKPKKRSKDSKKSRKRKEKDSSPVRLSSFFAKGGESSSSDGEP